MKITLKLKLFDRYEIASLTVSVDSPPSVASPLTPTVAGAVKSVTRAWTKAMTL